MLEMILVSVWVVLNVLVAIFVSEEEMKEDFIEGQGFFGRIFSNGFYSLAWGFKKLCKSLK